MNTTGDYRTVVIETDDGVCTITLNRPDSLNAFNETMKAELLDALKKAERDRSVRCLDCLSHSTDRSAHEPLG